MNSNQNGGETKGKLELLDSGEQVLLTLNFLVNPQNFVVRKSFNYDIEPLLGKSESIVNYRSANPSELVVSLSFYNESAKGFSANSSMCEIALEFLREASTVDPEISSLRMVKFRMGTFTFQGYISNYTYRPSNFSSSGSITRMMVDLSIVSMGKGLNA
jgi:hypothetical protein